MTGSGSGVIALWNIKTRSLIKSFIEYGVYSVDNFTLNDPYDGKWAPDGSCFVVGSSLGTISLFSNDGAAHKY
jgi:WD40 repeat protein